MTKGKGEDSPKQNRPEQDNSWQDIQSQDDHLNNSNRHNNNPPYEGSPETQSNPNPSDNGNQNSNQNSNGGNDNQGTGAGVSGRPNSISNHNPSKSTNEPNFHDGPVPGGADNTRGENVPRAEGHGGGAKRAMPDDGPDSPQGSNAYPSDTRGADSSDKEFRNNQPNASTLKAHKGDAQLAEDLDEAKRINKQASSGGSSDSDTSSK